jgi:inosine-uridine nucleoside N-ribohydrolase
MIATGPLTNIGGMITSIPGTASRISGITFMGGTIHEPGNISAGAEFNMYADPANAEKVLNCAIPKTMVGLDVTRRIVLKPDMLIPDLESMKHPNGELLAQMIKYYLGFHRRMRGLDGCYLHDPLAVAVAVDESLVDIEEMHLEIETAGEFTRGMITPDLAPDSGTDVNCRVCMGVDSDRFFDFFITRILNFLRNRWNA